jgi:uncharacterized membrane protein
MRARTNPLWFKARPEGATCALQTAEVVMVYLFGVYGMIAVAGLVFAVMLTAMLTAMVYTYSAISLCMARMKSHHHDVKARIVRGRPVAH